MKTLNLVFKWLLFAVLLFILIFTDKTAIRIGALIVLPFTPLFKRFRETLFSAFPRKLVRSVVTVSVLISTAALVALFAVSNQSITPQMLSISDAHPPIAADTGAIGRSDKLQDEEETLATSERITEQYESNSQKSTQYETADGSEPVDTAKQAERTQSNEQSYVLNTNTGKFHKPECAHAQKIKPANRREFQGTREEAESLGYVPCKVCKP
mgnify:CR=1 FL=1